MSFSIKLSLLAILTVAPAYCGEAWPHFRGTNGDGIVAFPDVSRLEHLKTGLRILWQRPFQDDKSLDKGPEYGRYNSYSAPAVSDGGVFVCRRRGNADEIACFDALSGDERWRFTFESESVKKNFGGGVRGVPCVHGEYVFIVNYWNTLVCLNRKDGKPVWKKDLRTEYGGKLPDFGTSASPVVLDGKLIVHPCGAGSAIVALDPASGREIWKAGTHDPAYATPQLATLSGVSQILAFLASGVASFDATTGRELWTFKYYEDWQKNSCVPLVVNGTVIAGNNTLGTTAFQPEKNGEVWTTKVLWSNQREKWHFASAVLGDGCVYYNDGKGAVKSLDTQSGKLNWAVHDMGRTWAGIVRLGEKHLLTAADNGQLSLIEATPRDFSGITRYQFLGIAFVQPAIAEGRIYVQDFQNLYCLALSPELAKSSEGKLLTPLPPVPEDHSLSRYARQYFKTFRVGIFAALAMALLGVLLAHAGQRSTGAASAGLAALGVAVALYIGATYVGPEVKRYTSARFVTNLALAFGITGGFFLTLMRLVSDARGKSGLEHGVTAFQAALTIGALILLSRTNLALVDIGSLVRSSIIRDRTVAYGDLQVALGAALVLATALFSQKRWNGNVLQLRSWQRVLLGLVDSLAIAYTVRQTGLALTLACLIFPAMGAVKAAGSRAWHAYWIAPLTASIALIAGFYYGFRFNASPGWSAAVAVTGSGLLLYGIAALRGRPTAADSSPAVPTPFASPWARRWALLALFVFGIVILDNSINLRAIYQSMSPHNIARYRPDFVTGGEANWPSFRGPYQNNVVPAGEWPTEFSRGEDGKTKGIRWTAEIPGKGRSSPVVWGEHLFLTSATDAGLEVFCYNTQDGKLRWQKRLSAVPSEKLPLSGWAAPTGVCNGKVFVALFSSGDIAALDFNGAILWQKNLGKLQNMYGYGSSLALWKDRVFVQLDVDAGSGTESALLALKPESGETIWKQPRKEGASWSTPVVLRTKAGDQLVTCAAPNVVAYNPENGKEIWRAGVLSGDVVPSAILALGRVIVCNDQAAIAAIDCDGTGDVTASKVVWKKDGTDFPDTASPITNGEYVYLFCSNAKVSCWRAETGEKVWEKELENGFTASPLLVGKEIYAFNSNGVLLRLEPSDTYDEAGQSELNDNVSATPAFANGCLFVRGEHGLYCIAPGKSAK